jgi:hypothetical protein
VASLTNDLSMSLEADGFHSGSSARHIIARPAQRRTRVRSAIISTHCQALAKSTPSLVFRSEHSQSKSLSWLCLFVESLGSASQLLTYVGGLRSNIWSCLRVTEPHARPPRPSLPPSGSSLGPPVLGLKHRKWLSHQWTSLPKLCICLHGGD